MTKLLMLGVGMAIAGCGSEAELPDGSKSETAIELRGLVPADAVLVGTTITPDGKHYVLDQRSGIYELSDSKATLVWNTTGLGGVELTDVVALDANRFAVTAENDGFLLDLETHAISSYFCYLPPIQPDLTEDPVSVSQTLQQQGIQVKQRTESVAFNPVSRQLFAQPQTIRLDNGAVAGSELFVFAPEGGEPIQVRPLASSFIAGGMVTAAEDRLIFGAGAQIYELTLESEFKYIRSLNAGTNVTGMARSPSDELWILDGAAQRLVKLEDL
jgi:hypothetical protein